MPYYYNNKMSLVKSLRHAGISAILFLLVSLPQVYTESNKFLVEQGPCPNYKSKLMHFVVFLALAILVIKYVMKIGKSFSDVIGYALYAGLLYYFISSPEMYQLTNSIVGGSVQLVEGSCPTIAGILVHTAVYALSLASWQLYFPTEDIFA